MRIMTGFLAVLLLSGLGYGLFQQHQLLVLNEQALYHRQRLILAAEQIHTEVFGLRTTITSEALVLRSLLQQVNAHPVESSILPGATKE